MRWLIRDEELDGVEEPDWAGYLAHLSALKPSFSVNLVELSETSLHDGLIERLTINEPKRTVTLRLVIGDLQRGYSTARIKYHGAALSVRGASLRWLVEYEQTEIIVDELEATGAGLEHRILFWPAGEIHIRFESATLRTKPLPDRNRKKPRLRWTPAGDWESWR